MNGQGNHAASPNFAKCKLTQYFQFMNFKESAHP